MAKQKPLKIPVGEKVENDMADVTAKFAEHAANRLLDIANMAHGDLKTVSKAQDYDYLEAKRMVDLPEALGAREVGSKVNPAGPAPA